MNLQLSKPTRGPKTCAAAFADVEDQDADVRVAKVDVDASRRKTLQKAKVLGATDTGENALVVARAQANIPALNRGRTTCDVNVEPLGGRQFRKPVQQRMIVAWPGEALERR